MAKSIVGKVVSLSDGSTAVVKVSSKIKHQLYKKYVTRERKYTVDTGGLELLAGCFVSFKPCRPISKTKTHVVVSVNN